ncbi:MAG TPA: winged-helix domain-containing protein, partial [Anaerolineaceae bacterium]|nr:winged-helix domain-containing protein [Anaerolineaceae bacterium]
MNAVNQLLDVFNRVLADFRPNLFRIVIKLENTMAPKLIPDIIVSRLPRYLQVLRSMAHEGKTTTSSLDLGERLNISAAQIRKDLSQFGEFGKQGTGYSIAF